MIIQTIDIPDKTMFKGFEFSNYRFLHDRKASIKETYIQPVIYGQLNGIRQVFIVYFQLNKKTVSKKIRIRVINGSILNMSAPFERSYKDEIILDAEENTGRRLFFCFDCNPVYV